MDAEGAAAAARVLADPWPGARAVRRVEEVAAFLASEGRWSPAAPVDSLVEDPRALDVVVAALARRDAWGAACELVEAALLRSCSEDGRWLYESFWAAERLCGEFRPAPARLLPALKAVLTWRCDGTQTPPWMASLPGDAAELIGRFGADAAPATDALATLAEDASSPANADHALAALIRLGDDRAAAFLAAHLADRPRALRAAVEHALPFTPGLLAAVGNRLRTMPKPFAVENDQAANRPEDPAFVLLIALLRSWGPQAHEAVPELCDLLEEAVHTILAARAAQAVRAADASAESGRQAKVGTGVPGERVPEQVAAALAVVGSGEGRERAEAALRRVMSVGGTRERLGAARAWWRLTGDADPLLAGISMLVGAKGSREDKGLRQDAATACRELGEDARPLLPVLLPLLDRPKPRRLSRLVDVAVTVWHLTGDTAQVLPVLDAALAAPASAPKAVLAVQELGPAAFPLAERVSHQLYDLYRLPETVRALIRISPDLRRLPATCSPPRLIDLLLASAGEAYDPAPAFAVITELGTEHLTDVHLRLLRAYATQDQRVPRKHSPPCIPADTALRAAARTLLESIDREEPPR